jgi:hypothetical protein
MHVDLKEVAAVARSVDFSRFDIYRTIHKALRLRMSELLVATGRLDCGNDDEVASLCASLDEFCAFCISHLEHEDEFIHPALEARMPLSSWKINAEHRDHERDIETLMAAADALRRAPVSARSLHAQMVYHTLGLFIAHNLMHMYVEETEHNRTLWQYYSDDEIREINARLLAHVTQTQMTYGLRYMLPAMQPEERVTMLLEIRATAPIEAYRAISAQAQEVLDSQAWYHLAQALDLIPLSHEVTQ